MMLLRARVLSMGIAALLALAGLMIMLSGLGRAEPAATWTVSNVQDSGPGSLRQAILEANAAPGTDVIQITAVGLITLLSPLPVITEAVSIQGPGAALLAVDGGNTWRVLAATAVSLTLTDLTIQHGRPLTGEGGGLWTTGALTLRGVNILSNTAPTQGGGAAVGGSLYMEGGRVANNRSVGGIGGGVQAEQAVISGTYFISNTAPGQGGGAALGAFSYVSDGRFSANRSLNAHGGGLYAAGPITLTNMVFQDNSARSDGGGVLAFGQAFVYQSQFINNQGGNRGGALYAGSVLVVENSAFIANSGGRGGAVYHGVYTGRFTNDLFAGNTATIAGGQLLLRGPSTVEMRHVTAVGMGSGTAVYALNSSVSLTNTIIATHAIGIDNVNGSVSEDYTLFFGNGQDSQGLVSGGGHSLNGDPRFIHADSGNYHLGAGSAAIDTGTDAGIGTDYDGDVRPLAAGFDIGFDEASPFIAVPPSDQIYLPLVKR